VRLVSVSNKRGTISAKVELDVKTATSVKRQEVTVSDGDAELGPVQKCHTSFT
jgi:type III restriction enzyme